MVEEADATDDLASGADGVAGEVGRVSNDHLGLSHLVPALDAIGDAVGVLKNLVDIAVEHEGTAVNGTEAGETLGEAAETVYGVNVGAGAIPGKGIAVDLELLDGGRAGLSR